ncbi:hypothetical protein O1M54_10090 [Streptomyces diastatochromogenes]|nr:hypothetical protein [Streptomyces diastatochromogenes]
MAAHGQATGPTLTDILSAGGPRPDAGSAASILNETAQTLLALHTAGLTHGSLAPDTVVLAPDGVALLAETALSAVLGDAPAAAVRLPGDVPPRTPGRPTPPPGPPWPAPSAPPGPRPEPPRRTCSPTAPPPPSPRD